MAEYTVYMHTNKLNGKKYVGITTQKVKARWQGGKHYSRHARFYADILYFGWDNFNHEVLYDGLTKDQAEIIERKLIKEYDLTNSEKGYNTRNGGKANTTLNDKSKTKLSVRNKGENNPFYNKKHTEEARLKMSYNRPRKSVFCIDTKTSYKSAREAERLTGAYHSDILKCCRGLASKAGGLHWKFEEVA